MQNEELKETRQPQTGPKRLQKAPVGKTVGKVVLRVLAVLLTAVVALAATLLISLKMICSETFPSAQQMFVTTVLETGQMKFLASIFLSPEEIQAIVDQNSMQGLEADVDTDLIQVGGGQNESQEEIEIVNVAGST